MATCTESFKRIAKSAWKDVKEGLRDVYLGSFQGRKISYQKIKKNYPIELLPFRPSRELLDREGILNENPLPSQAVLENISPIQELPKNKPFIERINEISIDKIVKLAILFLGLTTTVYSKFALALGMTMGSLLAVHYHCKEESSIVNLSSGDLKSRTLNHLVLTSFSKFLNGLVFLASKVSNFVLIGFFATALLTGFALGYQTVDFILDEFDRNPKTNPSWSQRNPETFAKEKSLKRKEKVFQLNRHMHTRMLGRMERWKSLLEREEA